VPKPVDQHHRRAAVSIALDVNGAWPTGMRRRSASMGKKPGSRVVERRSACRIADKLVVQMAIGPAFASRPDDRFMTSERAALTVRTLHG
jgi:hypothetical protein